MISAVLFLSFFVFLIMGIPISICLGLSSVCAILYSGTSLTIVATNMYSGISKFLLLAIPFFVLSGNIMAKAGISSSLLLRSDLRFRSCYRCCSWLCTDPGYDPAGWFFRSFLYRAYGNSQLHRHCHTTKYRIRCLRLHHWRFHC